MIRIVKTIIIDTILLRMKIGNKYSSFQLINYMILLWIHSSLLRYIVFLQKYGFYSVSVLLRLRELLTLQTNLSQFKQSYFKLNLCIRGKVVEGVPYWLHGTDV